MPCIALGAGMLDQKWLECAFALSVATILGSCASTQLNYNTLDIASTVDDLYTRQALNNLSRVIDEPFALPSQLDLLQGTIQTSVTVNPSANFPLSKSITDTATQAGAAITNTHTKVLAGVGLTASASDVWQQNWNVVPLSDANTLRNLRALYRYVVYPDVSLATEYTIARLMQTGKFVRDPYALAEPQCVICSRTPFAKDPALYVNRRLMKGWLYWTGAGVSGLQHPPPADTPLVNLGTYGSHQLLMTAADFEAGYLSDFVLFLMPVSPLTSGANPAKPGSATPGGRAAPTAGRGPFDVKPTPAPAGIVP
jgi:hypothetical protein